MVQNFALCKKIQLLYFLLVNCATASNGDDEFCYCNTCSENEGDCDTHDECQDGLSCGLNNCPASLGFGSEIDCCYQSTLGDEHFCASGIPCGENEGDCDAHDECQDGLFCGSNNCPALLGFDSEVDCCYQPTLGDEHFCESGIPCSENEGDCDAHNECQAGLACGSNNCPSSLGFGSELDCCSKSKIGKLREMSFLHIHYIIEV